MCKGFSTKKNRPMGSDGELGLYEKGGVSGRTNNH